MISNKSWIFRCFGPRGNTEQNNICTVIKTTSDETGRDWTGRGGSGRDGTGLDGIGRGGARWERAGLDGTARDGAGLDGTGRAWTGGDGRGGMRGGGSYPFSFDGGAPMVKPRGDMGAFFGMYGTLQLYMGTVSIRYGSILNLACDRVTKKMSV